MKTRLLLLVVTFLAACEPEEEDTVAPPSTIEINQTDFYRGIYRSNLSCVSTNKYPCDHYELVSENSFDGETFSIFFTEARPTRETCVNSWFMFATSEIFIDEIPNGTYRLKINNRGWANTGIFKISDTEIALKISDQKGIRITNSVIRKVPVNTYIGLIIRENENHGDKVNELLGKIEDLNVDNFNHQIPGRYSRYVIDDDGTVNVPDRKIHTGIIFQYNGADTARFNRQLHELIKEYHQYFSTSITTYANKYLESRI